ncbi:MAG: class I SAM-dependent methyltransferase [Saprospiraceae bacterium]|nr:class I SAM-dependent methyltransferase [Saprospiraceae bacterium]
MMEEVYLFENNSFDSVFSSEVFEHIFNLDDVLNEIQRVLKPGGRLLITVPFVWDEHEIPYDFGRYSSYGITHLLEKNGFYVVKHIKSSTYIETIGQLIINYIYQNLFPKSTFIKIILTPLIITPLIFLIKILNIILPDNTNFYLTNIVLAIKK